MEDLTSSIERRLKTKKHCRVYSNQLDELWPPTDAETALRDERIKAIKEYAKSNGWSVTVRNGGLWATFKPNSN